MNRLQWARLFQRRMVLVAAVLLAGLLLLSWAFPWVAGQDPSDTNVMSRLKAPSAEHRLGTDELGRDLLARIAAGGRHSMAIAAVTALAATLAGTVLGLLAGFVRPLEAPLMRLVDAMMALPDLLLAIALVAILGPSAWTVVLALSLVYTPRVARVVRASTLVVRELPFIEAARALGMTDARVLFRHVLPQLTSPLLVQASFIFAYAILAEAALSFLGVGMPPEVPTWGTMVAGSQTYAHTSLGVVLYPGLAIVLTSLCLQLLGDGLRDLLDPRLQRTT